MLRLHPRTVKCLRGNSLCNPLLRFQHGADLGSRHRCGGGVVHHDDDLDLVVLAVARCGVQLNLAVSVPAALDDLFCDIIRDVRHSGFRQCSAVGLRDSKSRTGDERQQHDQRQDPCTATFKCCHLEFLLKSFVQSGTQTATLNLRILYRRQITSAMNRLGNFPCDMSINLDIFNKFYRFLFPVCGRPAAARRLRGHLPE